jgi:hypothetical protein
MAFSVHLLAVTGGVESDDALWIPLHAETGPKEDHAVLALQHILSKNFLQCLKSFLFKRLLVIQRESKRNCSFITVDFAIAASQNVFCA